MAAPPSKPRNSSPQLPEDLAEVERALSVLQGRTPEFERIKREDNERTAQRKAEIDDASKKETRRIRSRRALIGGGIAVVGTLLVVAALGFRSELARRGRIEQAADPYRALGFTLLETTSRDEPSKLEATAPAGCVIAASTTGPATKLRLAWPGGTVEGPGPILTCLCEGGRVTVSGDMKPGEGLVLLRTEASALGGSRAFAFLPFRPGTTARSDQACAEGSLDAWLDAKRWTQESPQGAARPLAPVDAAGSEKWLGARPERAVLKAAGLQVTTLVKKESPFAVVEIPAETCVVLAVERPTDRPSLRLKGGTLAIGAAPGSAVWCTSTEVFALAQREGEGELAVLTGPASRVGGLEGARQAAQSAGLTIGAEMVAPTDRGWSAKQQLLASAIPETLITVANTPDLDVDKEARIVAVSVEKAGSLLAETPADVYSFCEPQLEKATASLCVFSGTQKWRLQGAESVGGLARAKMPFWLFGLEGVSEPAGLKLEVQLVNLARKLRRDGFEPTTIEALTEVDKGVEVLGRANEDAIVAVGLSQVEPWVFPYTDSATWSLDDEPRIVPIKPLERVTLTSASKKPLPPKASRRTVVFRRQKH